MSNPYGQPPTPPGPPTGSGQSSGYGQPQQPPTYGAPQQPTYGSPPPPHGAPTYETPAPYGSPPAPPAPAQGNGFAVASLIFGIIGGSLLGLIFGFIGLSKAKKIGGKGRGMSIAGIILSVVWLVASIGIVVYVATQVVEQNDPGCAAARAFILDEENMQFDTSSEAALKADLQAVVDELNADADLARNAEAKTAIKAMANDFKELLDAIDSGALPGADFDSRITRDGAAIDAACGTIGA
jgi:predicted lipid-binding transport protein (Tim44 family)